MTDFYNTALEYLAQLDYLTIGLIALFPALFALIQILKKSKPTLTIQQQIDIFKKDKRRIEVKDLNIKKCISGLSTGIASIGCVHFGFRIGIEAGIAAICISLLFYSFSTSINRKWRWYNALLDGGILVLFIVFEVAVFTGNYKSQAVAGVSDKVTQERQRLITKQEKLESQIVPVTSTLSRRERANAQYQNRTLNERIEEIEGLLPAIPDRNETEFFAGIAKVSDQDMDLAELYFYLCLSSLLIIGNTLHNTRINSYYSNNTLKAFINSLEIEIDIIKSAGSSSGNTGSDKPSRSQGSRAHANDSNFEPNVEKMVSFLSKKTGGYNVTEKVIKRETKATNQQVKLIRGQLIKLGWISQGENGNAAKYVKATPNLQAVG